MVLFFEQMVTATEGIFRSRNGEIVFSDIPKGLFTADNANSTEYENIVLAGRVIGNKGNFSIRRGVQGLGAACC